jgi:hypothetical protein
MGKRVHIIPVGFDFDRLIHPISKKELEADRVVLVTHDDWDDFGEQDRAAELAGNIVQRLEESFDLIDVDVEKSYLEHEEMYDFERLYPKAHDQMRGELNEKNEVFVNISSMPRTVSFAFATAADSLITDNPDDIEDIRQKLHTYYVRPDQYVVHELLDALESQIDFLESIHDSEASKRKSELQSLVDKVKAGGVTEGTKSPPGSDEMFVEFPTSPGGEIEEMEAKILRFLADRDEPVPSTSKLSKNLAEKHDEEYGDSYRSKVQYNVTRLEEKGYVNRKTAGNRTETTLSTMGRMWVETH